MKEKCAEVYFYPFQKQLCLNGVTSGEDDSPGHDPVEGDYQRVPDLTGPAAQPACCC